MTAAPRPVNGPVPLTVLAYLYTRVSTKEQGIEGLSLPTQDRDGIRYIARNDWQHARTFSDILSGLKNDRPGYQALKTAIRGSVLAGHRVVLVLAALDRLGRNAAERIDTYNELRDLGVELHTVDHGRWDEFEHNLFAILAQEESRRTGIRVSGIRRAIKASGWHTPGREPWGYRWREATAEERGRGAPKSVLDVDPDERPFVVEAWRQLASGASLHAVSRYVTSLPSSARGGRNFTFGTLRRLFRSPVYIARHKEDGVPLASLADAEGCRWPALIEDDVWRRVHGRATARTLPPQASGKYLLTGLIRCFRCGARMGGRPKTDGRRTYACLGWSGGAVTGETARCYTTIPAETVERDVVERACAIFGAFTGEARDIDAISTAWEDIRGEQDTDGTAEELAALEQQMTVARAKLAGITGKFAVGEIDKLAHDNARAIFGGELEDAMKRHAELAGRVRATDIPSFWDLVEEYSGWASVIAEAWRTEPDRARAGIAELFETVTPVRVGRGAYHVQMTPTLTGTAAERLGRAAGMLPGTAHVDAYGSMKAPTCAQQPREDAA